jgi:hypothetical protein
MLTLEKTASALEIKAENIKRRINKKKRKIFKPGFSIKKLMFKMKHSSGGTKKQHLSMPFI